MVTPASWRTGHTFIWETQPLTGDTCNINSVSENFTTSPTYSFMEKNAEKSPARASDAESRRLSKPGKRAALTRWLHSNERRVRQSRQQTDDRKWLIEKPEQPLVFIALMETGISNSWERYPLFSFRGLGFSLKSVPGVTSPEHVFPVVLRCTCRLYSPARHPVPWGCSLELGLGALQWSSPAPAPAVPRLPRHGLARGGTCEGTFQLTGAGEGAPAPCLREGGQAELRRATAGVWGNVKVTCKRRRWTSGICRSVRSCVNGSSLAHPGGWVPLQSGATEPPLKVHLRDVKFPSFTRLFTFTVFFRY